AAFPPRLALPAPPLEGSHEPDPWTSAVSIELPKKISQVGVAVTQIHAVEREPEFRAIVGNRAPRGGAGIPVHMGEPPATRSTRRRRRHPVAAAAAAGRTWSSPRPAARRGVAARDRGPLESRAPRARRSPAPGCEPARPATRPLRPRTPGGPGW